MPATLALLLTELTTLMGDADFAPFILIGGLTAILGMFFYVVGKLGRVLR